MALDQTAGIYLVVKGGYGFTSEEQWQFGIRYFAGYSLSNPPTTGTPSLSDTDAAAVSRSETDWDITSEWLLTASGHTFSPDDWLNDSVAPAMATFMAGTWVSGQCRTDSLVAYPIGSDGKVVDGRKAVLTWHTPLPGGGGSSMMPMETSIVTSWNTDEIGRKGRGRIYLPPSDSTYLATHGFVETAGTVGIRDAAVAMLEDSAQSPTGPIGWRIWPAVMPQIPTRYGIITSVRVGNVFDRQASRRRSIPEVYTAPGAVSL